MGQDDEFVSLFGDTFVAGAAHKELSAAERLAEAAVAQKDWNDRKRRHQRSQRKTARKARWAARIPGGKARTVVVIAGSVWWQGRGADPRVGADLQPGRPHVRRPRPGPDRRPGPRPRWRRLLRPRIVVHPAWE